MEVFSSAEITSTLALLEPGQPFFEKALAPLGDDLYRDRQTSGNLRVLKTLCSHEHDLGPYDIAIR